MVQEIIFAYQLLPHYGKSCFWFSLHHGCGGRLYIVLPYQPACMTAEFNKSHVLDEAMGTARLPCGYCC